MKFSLGGAPAPSPAPDIAEIRTQHATVRYPTSFEPVEHEGAELVLALRDAGSGFRPNVVLTAVASTAGLPDASFTAMLAAGAQHPAAHVHSCDLWDAADGDGPARARRIVFSYRGDQTRDVLVHKWVWATGAHHVHLSASCLPSQVHAVSAVFEWIALQLVLAAPATAVTTAAAKAVEAPVDERATARAGFALEDLGAVPHPAFRSRGPVVTTPALQALLNATSRRRVGATRGILTREEAGATVAELGDAGFTDERGRVTAAGALAAKALSGRPLATVKVRRGARAEAMVALACDAGVVVVHGAGLHESPLGGDRRHVHVLSAEQAPGVLAAWIGLRPFWSFSDGDEQVSDAALERHLGREDPSDPEAWTEVLVRDTRGERYDALSATRGFLRIGPPTRDGHAVQPDPSGSLYERLLHACEAAYRS